MHPPYLGNRAPQGLPAVWGVGEGKGGTNFSSPTRWRRRLAPPAGGSGPARLAGRNFGRPYLRSRRAQDETETTLFPKGDVPNAKTGSAGPPGRLLKSAPAEVVRTSSPAPSARTVARNRNPRPRSRKPRVSSLIVILWRAALWAAVSALRADQAGRSPESRVWTTRATSPGSCEKTFDPQNSSFEASEAPPAVEGGG